MLCKFFPLKIFLQVKILCNVFFQGLSTEALIISLDRRKTVTDLLQTVVKVILGDCVCN